MGLLLDDIKLMNREITKQIPPRDIEALLDERNVLVRKKLKSGLSPKEDKRLTLVRWQLDRIDDAQHGEHLDYLEKLTENYEKFATDINVLFDQL